MSKLSDLAIEALLSEGLITRSGDSFEFCGSKKPVVSEKKKTPLQRIVEAYKHAKGVPMDDKLWDKACFARASRAGKSLLACFGGDLDKAAVYLFKRAEDLNDKGLDWTLETITRHAYDGMGMQKESDGFNDKPLGSNLLDGRGRTRRITPSGEIAGDALRGIEQAAIHSEGASDLGGHESFISGDDEFIS